MLFSLISLAFAEPTIYYLSHGEPAPFDGRLLNDEAILPFMAKTEFDIKQCQIAYDLDLDVRMLERDLRISALETELEDTVDRYNTILSLKEEEITHAIKNRKINNWIFLGGFTVGIMTTVSLYNIDKD